MLCRLRREWCGGSGEGTAGSATIMLQSVCVMGAELGQRGSVFGFRALHAQTRRETWLAAGESNAVQLSEPAWCLICRRNGSTTAGWPIPRHLCCHAIVHTLHHIAQQNQLSLSCPHCSFQHFPKLLQSLHYLALAHVQRRNEAQTLIHHPPSTAADPHACTPCSPRPHYQPPPRRYPAPHPPSVRVHVRRRWGRCVAERADRP